MDERCGDVAELMPDHIKVKGRYYELSPLMLALFKLEHKELEEKNGS